MTSQASTAAADAGTLASTILIALAGAGLVTGVLAGARIPFVSSDRDAFIALAVLGWIGCTVAVGRVTADVGWMHPLVIAAACLGVAVLAVIGSVALGHAGLFTALGGGSGERGAFLVLASLLAAKVALRIVAWTLPRNG